MSEFSGVAIVRLLCAGHSAQSILKKLGITQHTMDQKVRALRLGDCLPRNKRDYPLHSSTILANLEAYAEYDIATTKLHEAYIVKLKKIE